VSYEGPDFGNGGGTLKAEFFFVRDVPAEALNVTEDALAIFNRQEIADLWARCAPIAWLVLTRFLDPERSSGHGAEAF